MVEIEEQVMACVKTLRKEILSSYVTDKSVGFTLCHLVNTLVMIYLITLHRWLNLLGRQYNTVS
jgi:hypothetical protein